MSAMTIFYQECPICGRNLRIPAKYFGRLMSCTHCEGEFRAGNEQLPQELTEETPARRIDVASVSHPVRPDAFSPQLGEV